MASIDGVLDSCGSVELYSLTPARKAVLVEVYNKMHPENQVASVEYEVRRMGEPCSSCLHTIGFDEKYFCIRERLQ